MRRWTGFPSQQPGCPAPRSSHARRGPLAGVALLAAGVAAGAVSPAVAHHGFGTYDLNADIRVAGVLVGIDFVNPHSWLHIEAPGPDGEPAVYHCEMRAAAVLRRSGWTREMFTVGDPIIMDGAPDRRNPTGCYVGSVTFADGSTIDRYGQITPPEEQHAVTREARRADGRPNFAGLWTLEQLVMTDPRGLVGGLMPVTAAREMAPGDLPPGAAPFPGSRGADPSLRSFATSPVELTEQGQALADAYDDQSPAINPRLRCEATSIIFDWTFDQPIHRIGQTDTEIVIEYGQHELVRTIHLDGRGHPADLAPSRAGHSVGQWEDDVLVVETIGFEPGIIGPPVYHGERLRVTERYWLDEETGGLRRQYSATDPDYWAGEYRGADHILPSAIPFDTTPCEEPDFREYSGD